MEGYHRRAVFV